MGESLAQSLGKYPDLKMLKEQHERFENRHKTSEYVNEPTERGLKYIEKVQALTHTPISVPSVSKSLK